MKAILLDGTAQEIQEAIASFTGSGAAVLIESASVADGKPLAAPVPADAEASEDGEIMSLAACRNYLTRIPLKDSQKTVLKTIAEGGESTVPASKIMKALNYSGPQFRGIMGAMGKRCAATKGYVDGQLLFIQFWNPSTMENDYMLPNTMREAMKLEGLI